MFKGNNKIRLFIIFLFFGNRWKTRLLWIKNHYDKDEITTAHVRCIKILTWLRGFLVIFLDLFFIVVFKSLVRIHKPKYWANKLSIHSHPISLSVKRNIGTVTANWKSFQIAQNASLGQKDDNIKQARWHNVYLTLINIYIFSDINIATDEVNGKSNTFIIKLQSGYTKRLCE